MKDPTQEPSRSFGRRRARSSIRFGVAAVAALGFITLGCGGGTKEAASNGGSEHPNANPEINADNCPVKALDKATGPVQITVWHAYNALTQQALEKSVADYNASQTKVKVDVEAQGSYPELLKKYSDRLSDKTSLPDVIFSEDTTLRFMVDSGSVIPSGDCIAADPSSKQFYDQIVPVVKSTYAIKDVLWPAAFGVSMPILYVNNAQLKEAGLSDSTPLATLADIRAAAEKLKAANIPGLEAPVVMQLYGWYYENWVTGAGETIVNESNGHDGLATKSTVDNKAAQDVLEWMHLMVKDGLMKAYPYSTGIDQYLAMGNKSAAILIDGSRAITSVNAITQNSGQKIEGAEGVNPADLKGIELRVLPVPGLKKAGQGGAAGSAAYLVASDHAEKVAASWDFIKFFNGEASQIEWTKTGSYLPVTPQVRDSAELKDFFSNDSGGKLLSIVEEQLQGSNPDFPNPIIGPYDWFRANVQSMMDRVVLQGEDPKPNLTKFSSDFQSQLDNYAKEVGG